MSGEEHTNGDDTPQFDVTRPLEPPAPDDGSDSDALPELEELHNTPPIAEGDPDADDTGVADGDGVTGGTDDTGGAVDPDAPSVPADDGGTPAAEGTVPETPYSEAEGAAKIASWMRYFEHDGIQWQKTHTKEPGERRESPIPQVPEKDFLKLATLLRSLASTTEPMPEEVRKLVQNMEWDLQSIRLKSKQSNDDTRAPSRDPEPEIKVTRDDSRIIEGIDQTLARLLYSPIDIAERPQETRARIQIPEKIQGISREAAQVFDAVDASGVGTAVFVPRMERNDDEFRESEKREYIKMMALASQLEARSAVPDVNFSLGQCLARFGLDLRREAWRDLEKIAVNWALLVLREYQNTVDAVCTNRSWYWLMFESRQMGQIYRDYIEGFIPDLRGVHEILVYLQRMIGDFRHHSEIEIEFYSTLFLDI